MARMKRGELIAEYLIKPKVPYLFGICGHGNVGILDSLHAVRDKLKLVSPRHEQCAGHMADAYFRVKHQPVATLTSTGPGSANLVMSLATALSDSSTFLAITSNVPTSQMNRAPFQAASPITRTSPPGPAPARSATSGRACSMCTSSRPRHTRNRFLASPGKPHEL